MLSTIDKHAHIPARTFTYIKWKNKTLNILLHNCIAFFNERHLHISLKTIYRNYSPLSLCTARVHFPLSQPEKCIFLLCFIPFQFMGTHTKADALLGHRNANTFRHFYLIGISTKNVILSASLNLGCTRVIWSISIVILFIYVPIFTFNCSSIRTSRVLSAILDP